MKEAGFTKQERNFLTLIRIWTVLFLLATTVFALAPDWLLLYVNAIGRSIFGWRETVLLPGNERFWVVLSVSMLATLTYICFVTQHDFLRNMDYAKAIIVSKLVSTLGFIFCFAALEQRFIYLVGALVDGMIFLITWYSYNAAVKSRSR